MIPKGRGAELGIRKKQRQVALIRQMQTRNTHCRPNMF